MIELFQNRPWVRKPDQKGAPPHPEPRGLYSEINITKSLEAMHNEAVALGLKKGVSFLCFRSFFEHAPRVAFIITGSLERDPIPGEKGDVGTNYFGIAMSKLAFMLSTDTNSGSGVRPLKDGEIAYKGGLIIITEEGSLILAGYSGGSEDQDLQIARKGMSTYIDLAERDIS